MTDGWRVEREGVVEGGEDGGGGGARAVWSLFQCGTCLTRERPDYTGPVSSRLGPLALVN